MSEPVGKWLTAEERLSKSGKTRIYALFPEKASKPIGFVGWYGPWRKYALQPEPNTVFEADCLAALSEFCARKTQEHKQQRLNADLRKSLGPDWMAQS